MASHKRVTYKVENPTLFFNKVNPTLVVELLKYPGTPLEWELPFTVAISKGTVRLGMAEETVQEITDKTTIADLVLQNKQYGEAIDSFKESLTKVHNRASELETMNAKLHRRCVDSEEKNIKLKAELEDLREALPEYEKAVRRWAGLSENNIALTTKEVIVSMREQCIRDAKELNKLRSEGTSESYQQIRKWLDITKDGSIQVAILDLKINNKNRHDELMRALNKIAEVRGTASGYAETLREIAKQFDKI